MIAGSSHSSSAGQESSPILQVRKKAPRGQETRQGLQPGPRPPTPGTALSPCWSSARGTGCPTPRRAQPWPVLSLGASLAFLAVNPTGAAANPVEERARLSARLGFVKGAPQARQDSGMPTGPPKPRKPRWGQPLVLLLQEALPALTGPSADSSGFRLLSCDMGTERGQWNPRGQGLARGSRSTNTALQILPVLHCPTFLSQTPLMSDTSICQHLGLFPLTPNN